MKHDGRRLGSDLVEREVQGVRDSFNALIDSLDPDKRPQGGPLRVRAQWDDSSDPEPPPWTGEVLNKDAYGKP